MLRLKFFFLLPLLVTTLFSCQPDKPGKPGAAASPQETVIDSARLAARRPAPSFYILTPEIYKNRVFICDDLYSDIFHTKYDCQELAGCTAPKKNVTLVAAIRDNGRYNCKTCSADLDHVFDETIIR